ncbi:MAG: hypothetical protein K940chlam9_00920 [Chlamydiae bacterium]|nr:hypothetical protein [Chlamydiota bacterium]
MLLFCHKKRDQANPNRRVLKGIGVLPGPRTQYIDHLVPLCQIMGIPILVTNAKVQALIERYYPPMEIILAEPEDYSLDPYLENYEVFFYVEWSRMGNGTFQFHEYTCSHRVRSVCSLHGHPDKHDEIYWLEKFASEEIILAYGPDLVEKMERKGIEKNPILTGNYRLAFFEKHRSFFTSRLPFEKNFPILLYAPTWTCENWKSELRHYFSPFFRHFEEIVSTFSPSFQLLVKLHPVTRFYQPDAVEQLQSSSPDLLFLEDYPPIYPLLEKTDLYVGDYSSIGYDFLYYDRPLLFSGTGQITPLQACGDVFTKDLDWKNLPAQPKRKEVYNAVYGPPKPLETLKQEIEDACRSPRN